MRAAHLLLLPVAPAAGWAVTPLNTPPASAYAAAIRRGLRGRYEEVTVSVVRGVDPSAWGWAAAGMGAPTLLDVGDTAFLRAAVCHNTTYNGTSLVAEVPALQQYNSPQGAWFGAAAADGAVLGRNGEAVMNRRVDGSAAASWGSYVDAAGALAVAPLPTDTVGPFGSLFVTDAAPAVEVVKVAVRGLLPSDEERFDFALQRALDSAQLGPVAMAGFIRLLGGEVTFHVMQDWLPGGADGLNINYYHPINAPLECATRIAANVTIDSVTKAAHTHCRSDDLSKVGHYQNDTAPPPNTPPHMFEAYLAPAAALVRVRESGDPACAVAAAAAALPGVTYRKGAA